jgi:hypothetical protein
MMARIASTSPDPPVVGVHGLSVDCNYFSSRSYQGAIRFLHVSTEVAVLSEFVNCVLTDPVYPLVFEPVDVIITIGSFKVFHIDWPSVVIALGGVNSDGCIFESVLNHFSNLESVVGHLFRSVSIGVMRRVVASPKHDIGLYNVTNVLEQTL